MKQEIVIADQLIIRFQQGEMAALQEIYELSKTYIYNIVYRMVLNTPETEDIVHDVFIKIYEKRDKYQKKMPFVGWLNRVAINHTLNLIKRNKNYYHKLEQIFKENPQTTEFEDTVVVEENAKLVLRLLKKLPSDYRICLILREMDSMSYEGIATVLNIRIGTVRSRLNRGRQQLAKLYQKEVSVNV